MKNLIMLCIAFIFSICTAISQEECTLDSIYQVTHGNGLFNNLSSFSVIRNVYHVNPDLYYLFSNNACGIRKIENEVESCLYYDPTFFILDSEVNTNGEIILLGLNNPPLPGMVTKAQVRVIDPSNGSVLYSHIFQETGEETLRWRPIGLEIGFDGDYVITTMSSGPTFDDVLVRLEIFNPTAWTHYTVDLDFTPIENDLVGGEIKFVTKTISLTTSGMFNSTPNGYIGVIWYEDDNLSYVYLSTDTSGLSNWWHLSEFSNESGDYYFTEAAFSGDKIFVTGQDGFVRGCEAGASSEFLKIDFNVQSNTLVGKTLEVDEENNLLLFGVDYLGSLPPEAGFTGSSNSNVAISTVSLDGGVITYTDSDLTFYAGDGPDRIHSMTKTDSGYIYALFSNSVSGSGNFYPNLDDKRYWIIKEDYVCPSVCLGDYNLDGFISVVDLSAFLGFSAPTLEICDEECLIGDFNGDGEVTTAGDLTGFLAAFGTTCPN